MAEKVDDKLVMFLCFTIRFTFIWTFSILFTRWHSLGLTGSELCHARNKFSFFSEIIPRPYLVEAHGGRIKVSSVPGKGTTFSLNLQAAQIRSNFGIGTYFRQTSGRGKRVFLLPPLRGYLNGDPVFVPRFNPGPSVLPGQQKQDPGNYPQQK